ncbi:MAG TPA: hypothetical protein DEB15_11135 [Pusillimonas sp.]|jgi:TM2 domain-containing membrane protein YozV|nr:hypothetical protein [Pusillimonas sp.]MBC41950.1 hypothetical protein [Pusillimonas sp.]HBT33333.1 hypothetical protein [Pusillimonas sp.]HCP78557.1 hypothetical protein [Pusillimonas sp.]|tara:strand:- start:128 stop:595 length:468 start_codon:yes stop_codon:yes gene_type:complete
MLRKALIPIAVFLIVLVALTFGETVGTQMLRWLNHLTGLVIHNFADVWYAVETFVRLHFTKIIIALVLTIPISIWLIRQQGEKLTRGVSTRKMAIILAIFLGWLGAHRFYLGQIGWGIIYLIILWIFPPLVVIISLIDAIRYAFMNDDEFPAVQS